MLRAMDVMARIRSQPGWTARISGILGITRGAVAQWQRVPAAHVTKVSELTGIAPHELRPDLAAHFMQPRGCCPMATE